MTQQIQTVTGSTTAADLGRTLMHEHLFVAIFKSNVPDENTPVTELDLWDQKVTLENLHLVRGDQVRTERPPPGQG